jgi:hypothetical protein
MDGTVVVYDSNIVGEGDLGLVGLNRWSLVRNWPIWGFLPGVLLISNLFLRGEPLPILILHRLYSLGDRHRLCWKASAALALS